MPETAFFCFIFEYWFLDPILGAFFDGNDYIHVWVDPVQLNSFWWGFFSKNKSKMFLFSQSCHCHEEKDQFGSLGGK